MGVSNPSSGGAWTQIANETLAADGRFDIVIDPVYNSLQIIASIRSNVAAGTDNIYLLFNNDSTDANYRRTSGRGSAANTPLAISESDIPLIGTMVANTAPANNFTPLQVFIPGVGLAQTKSAIAFSVDRPIAGEQIMTWLAMNWENTDAITRIQLQTNNHDTDLLLAGSNWQVYGLT